MPPPASHDGAVAYRQRPAGVAGVVLWERSVALARIRSRILPDGCLDLIWDGRALIVAGPDSTARWHESRAGNTYTGLRFHRGLGPALLQFPASEVLDRSPALAELWPAAAARRLAERVSEDPAGALLTWAAERTRDHPADPLGARVYMLARQAAPAAQMADQLGLSARQLHRRCLPVFGYGPRRLSRILRMTRALDQARAGRPLAEVAAVCGYADQAHLTRELVALGGSPPTLLLAESGGPRQRREQVDGGAVGVVDDGVAHAPEGVPGGEVALIARAGQVGVGRVDRGWSLAGEGQRGPVAAARRA
jgi:AraC-like DNA-binding protein